MSNKELQEQIEALKIQLAEAKKLKGRTLSWKVSEKGAISIYGFGRFPVTLYYTQLVKLNEVMPEVMKFAEEHKAELNIKTVTEVKVAA